MHCRTRPQRLETNSRPSTTRLSLDACRSRSKKLSVMRTVHSQLITVWKISGTITAMLSHSCTAIPVTAGL